AVTDSPMSINAFASPTLLDRSENILQIKNIGKTAVAFDWFAVASRPLFPSRLNFMIDDLEKIPYKERGRFQCGVVDLDLRKFKDAEMVFPKPVVDLKSPSEVPVWSLPRGKRMKSISELRKIIAGFISKNKQAGKTMKVFEKELVETLKCGKTPALRIEGASAKTAVRLIRLFKGFAGAFVFPNTKGDDAISNAASLSEVFAATRDGGSGTAAIHNSSGYSIEPVFKVLAGFAGQRSTLRSKRGDSRFLRLYEPYETRRRISDKKSQNTCKRIESLVLERGLGRVTEPCERRGAFFRRSDRGAKRHVARPRTFRLCRAG
ncbi:MAG: hypothetical protein GXP32_07685, partial [Kiritimatiellaeota bacterium]|nr:hypothetical protein [Kiritimatiellota bacterium]